MRSGVHVGKCASFCFVKTSITGKPEWMERPIS